MINSSEGDFKHLDELLRPAELVLSRGLEGIRRRDETERIDLWNRIKENQSKFEEEFLGVLARDLEEEMSGRFCLARLILIAAAYRNGENSLTTGDYNDTEIEMVQDFEKFNVFDVLDTKEIVERIARKEDIYELVIEFYHKEYMKLDDILDNPEIQRDLKLAFKKRYKKRFDKVVEGVQAYVGKYGPVIVVTQIENKIWDTIKESEDRRKSVVAELEKQLNELSSGIASPEEIDEANAKLREDLSAIEAGLAAGNAPQDILNIESQKNGIIERYLDIEKALAAQAEEIGQKRQEIENREEELEQERQEYQEQAQEENSRLLESELNELKTLKEDLLSQEEVFEADREELERKREELDSRLQDIKDALEGKPIRIVAKEDARLCELNFIARFNTKLETYPIKFSSPIDSKKYEIKSWSEGSHIKLAEETMPEMPANTRSRYAVSEKKWGFFGKKSDKVVIEAVSINHLEEFEKYGFDARRANISDFLGIISRFINSAEMGKYFHVLGIASPTGWDNRVKKEIESTDFAHNYVSRNVSICLVDSMTGDVFYNPEDDRISNFVEFFQPQFDKERVAEVKEFIRDRLALKNYVAFDDLLEEVNEKRDIIDKAFYDFEFEKNHRMRIIKDVGVVLEKTG